MLVVNSGKCFLAHLLIILISVGYQAQGQKVHRIENDPHGTLNQWNNTN